MLPPWTGRRRVNAAHNRKEKKERKRQGDKASAFHRFENEWEGGLRLRRWRERGWVREGCREGLKKETTNDFKNEIKSTIKAELWELFD